MKKIYALSSALLVAALGTVNTYANFTVDDIEYQTIDDNTARAYRYKGDATDVVFPSKVSDGETEYTVTEITSMIFRYSSKTGITSCVIPGTVKTCAASIFAQCRSLKKVTLEEGVEELGYQMFNGCGQLSEVSLPTTLTNLGGEGTFGSGAAFMECPNLTNIKIPAGIREIPESTFSGCINLTSVTIEGEITSIGNNAFYNCNALASDLSFPAVTSLGSTVFIYCYALKSVELGGTLENIPNETFYGCSSLEDVILGEGIKTIGEYAFNGCGALKTIAFPSTVTEIGANAFKGCNALTSVYCYSEVPPTANDNSFPGDVYTNATLFVSDTAEDAYKTATCWSKFENVQGISVGVEEITGIEVSVKAVAGGIAIEGTDAVAEIYTVSGQLAARTAAREIQLPAGLYIVRVAGISAKALVK